VVPADWLQIRVFRKALKRAKKSLKEASRKMITRWTKETSGISPEDPIFNLKSISYKDKKASENHDAVLYDKEF
jgi:hypothetical protein